MNLARTYLHFNLTPLFSSHLSLNFFHLYPKDAFVHRPAISRTTLAAQRELILSHFPRPNQNYITTYYVNLIETFSWCQAMIPCCNFWYKVGSAFEIMKEWNRLVQWRECFTFVLLNESFSFLNAKSQIPFKNKQRWGNLNCYKNKDQGLIEAKKPDGLHLCNCA